ncbi:MAG: 6-bladed beta-propeller [Candidatus Cloacimonas sp.]
MKKSLSMSVIILIGWAFLWAIPKPLQMVSASKDKKDAFGVDCFHLEGNIAYCVDNGRGIIKAWDITQKAFLGPVFIKLPVGTKINDLTGDENSLYVLDSKASAIYIYSYEGKYLRTISTKGSPDIQFGNAIRILVNYQGYIYILDSGRNELLSFTNEGMFLGKVQVMMPLSMCLSKDQKIRILVNLGQNQAVILYNQDLVSDNSIVLATPENKPDKLLDVAVNQYNELYVIYSICTKIGKVDAMGNLLPRSTWGSKNKNESMVSFQQPTAIKAIPYNGKTLVGILDGKVRSLKLYVDDEYSNTKPVEIPQLTLRPKLSESDEPQSIDYLYLNGTKYYIHKTTIPQDKTKKITDAITCVDKDSTIFNIYAAKEKNKGVKGFNALAIDNDKLLALDTKASKVFVYDRLSGDYIESFANKGSQNGCLNSPKSIAVDKEGMIYIADWGNSRIAVFDENTAHIRNIDLKSKVLKPQLLRISGQDLYFLANDTVIYKLSLTEDNTLQLVTSAGKISTFDLLYEDRVGYIDGITQQLNIIYNGINEHRYFAKNVKGTFPCFADISLLRYNPYTKTLLICDKTANCARLLTFYYSPQKPQTVFFTVNSSKQAVLSWEVAEGISRWIVTEKRSSEIFTYTVNEPHFVIDKPQKEICTYTVQSLSADNKAGPSSEEIADAYSYARYLSENKHYPEAVIALQLASKTFTGVNFAEEITDNCLKEAQLYISRNEFEKAIGSIDSLEKIIGAGIDTVIQRAEIYKMMNAYNLGIAALERYSNPNDKSILHELISLYYLDGNYYKVKDLCNIYVEKYNRDADILRYQVYAEEKTENYPAALNFMRELIAQEDNLDNNLKMGELLLKNNDYEAALNYLQRLMTKFNNQGADVIQKLMGDCFFAAGNYAYAVDKYTDAIHLNPSVAEYYYSLGSAYAKNRKAKEATENFAIAYQKVPTDVNYGFAYAQALDKEMRYSEALAVMDNIYQYIAIDSTTTAYHEFYHDLLVKEHRYDDAWREIQIALQYDPDNLVIQDKALKTEETRRYYNETRPEVEISFSEFYILYPALIGYFQTHPIGTLTLFNTRNISLEHITVTVTIPQITDRPFQTIIPSLMGGAEQQVDIIAPLNKEILDLCKYGPTTFAVDMQVEWVFDKNAKSDHKSGVIYAQSINSMDWNERKQYACFVNPADENLRNFVNTQIIQLFQTQPTSSLNKKIQRAVQIWSYYNVNGLKYISDNSSANLATSTVDYVQFPFQTLKQKAGDCDDLLVLLASSLSVIGIQCGFLDIPGHVVLVMNTGMNTEEILAGGFELNRFISDNGKYWLPLETTLLGKESFSVSWNEAAKQYNLLLSKGIYPELMEFDTLHKLYPPAPCTESISPKEFNNNVPAISQYQRDMESIMLMEKLSREEEFIATLQKYPTNFNVANQYALWCVENNRAEKAAELWNHILAKDPQNLAALINLGNLQLNNNDFAAARTNYLQAMSLNQNTDSILRNLCILEFRCGNQIQAREYFNLMSDKTILKKVNPQMYSELLNIGE